MAQKIFWIRESLEDDRPSCVTYDDPTGHFKTTDGYKKYQANASVSAGRSESSKDKWFAPDLRASERGLGSVAEWDYYMCSGSFGAFSSRAIEVLTPFWENRFEPLRAKLEGFDYLCLRCNGRIDCLDKNASDITYFEGSDDIMEITSYVFQKTVLRDPVIFAIPELVFQLFCTDSVPQLVADAGLRGIRFELVDDG